MKTNNHFIPKVYLKNWSYDGKTLFRYKLLVSDSREPEWQKSAIKTTAVKNNLYLAEVDGVELDYLEEEFDKRLETKLQPVFIKIRNQIPLQKDDWDILQRFLYAQRYRTIPGIQRLINMAQDNYHEVIDSLDVDQLVKDYNAGKHRPPDEEAELKENEKYIPLTFDMSRTEENLLGVHTVIGPSIINKMLQNILKKIPEDFSKYDWKIVRAADGFTFPTTDDPVIFLKYYSDNNYQFIEQLESYRDFIIMPISPKHLMLTRCMYADKETYSSRYWSRFLVKVIIEHANREVYSTDPIEGINMIRSRVVNPIQIAKEKEQINDWFIKGTEMEKQIRTSREELFSNLKKEEI